VCIKKESQRRKTRSVFAIKLKREGEDLQLPQLQTQAFSEGFASPISRTGGQREKISRMERLVYLKGHNQRSALQKKSPLNSPYDAKHPAKTSDNPKPCHKTIMRQIFYRAFYLRLFESGHNRGVPGNTRISLSKGKGRSRLRSNNRAASERLRVFEKGRKAGTSA